MTFFYDLNKKLDEIRATPEKTHGQLNERDTSRAAKSVDEGLGNALAAGFDKFDDAMATVGAKAKGLRANITGKPEHRQAAVDAHKGIMKKEYNKMRDAYPNSRMPLSGPGPSKRFDDAEQSAAMHKIGLDNNMEEGSTGDYSAKKARAGKDIGRPGKQFAKIAKGAAERYGSKKSGEKVAGAVLSKLRKGVGEAAKPDFLDLDKDGNKKEPMRQAAGQRKQGKDMTQDLVRGIEKSSGGKETARRDAKGVLQLVKKKKAAESKGPVDEVKLADLPVRQVKGRAYGAQPDEPEHDDVEADTTPKKKGRPKGTGRKMGAKGPTGRSKLMKKGALREGPMPPEYMADIGKLVKVIRSVETAAQLAVAKRMADNLIDKYGRMTANKDVATWAKTRNRTTSDVNSEIKPKERELGLSEQDMIDQGEYGMEGDHAKDDIHTLVRDAQALEQILGDSDDLPEWVQSKLTKAQGMISAVNDYMQTEHERDGEQEVEVELDEKAVSVSQRRAAGIAHAAQKGEMPKSKLRGASKEMAKMGKKELHKFAATKEKGLPAKKTAKKEVEETTTSGSVATAPAAEPKKGKGGMQFGKGIYDSMNRDLEAMIAESMSVNISSSTEGGDSVTVTATDQDAGTLKELLRNAGIGGDSHSDSGCGCGTTPCSCAEVVDENQPDWPTDEVTSDDALQYSGGLNKPKTDVAGAGQTTVPVTAVRVQEGEQELDESKCNECGMYESKCECDTEVDESLERMQSLAGIQEAKPDFLDLDRDGNKKEPMKKAADDKKAVKESGTGDAPISKMSDQDLADYCDMSVDEVKRDRARAEEVARDKTDDLKEGEAFQSSLLDMTRLWKQYKA
jgi:hypothetical protein